MKAEYLVVDSGGFIAEDSLWELGQNLFTLNEVIAEIKDTATRRRLQLLPYGLKIRKPSDHAMKIVKEFSRKTGDYASLSLTDIMVIALTYDLEVEHCGAEHLAKEPKMSKTVAFYQPKKDTHESDTKIEGFFKPGGSSAGQNKVKDGDEDFSSFQFWREPIPEIPLDIDLELATDTTSSSQQCPLSQQELQNLDSFLAARSFILDFGVSQVDACIADLLDSDTVSKYNNTKRWYNHIQSYGQIKKQQQNLSLEKMFAKIADGFDFGIEDVVVDDASASGEPISSDEGVGMNESDNENDEFEGSEEETGSDDDDDDGWITPSNIKDIKNKMVDEEEVNIKVGCITTDFAMQNVLKQIGLNILANNGRLIKETKTWLLRCHACFTTTAKLEKKFCPKCGNNTLKRVSVSVNPDGSQVVHISARRQLTGRGKKFPLPLPKGGKYAQNPRLFEDQPMPHQRVSKKAMVKNNPMDADWIAGNSPFTTKDVASRSALMGLRGDLGRSGSTNTGNYWDRKNPNEKRRGTGSKRKK